MAKGSKTGGRKKGTLNKSTKDAQAYVDAIFKRANPEELAVNLLNCNDPATRARVLALLLSYKFGQPRHAKEDNEALRGIAITVRHIGLA